ncbi:MAG: hypothetical protein PHF86_10810 [Candidatus Nanoarchaeia archaeon]|nr:hypothetical protein [Candidatus Nanoarchaeia archaeon]
MRKGQTEMMGLIILIILILISAIFAIRFILFNQEDIGPELKLQIQAYNLQSSLLKLTFDGKSFSDLVVLSCDNDNTFFKEQLPRLIESVLPSQNYEFEIQKATKTCYSSPKKCTKRVSSIGKISKNNEFYSLIIQLCY